MGRKALWVFSQCRSVAGRGEIKSREGERERGQRPTEEAEVSDRTMGHLTQKNKSVVLSRSLEKRTPCCAACEIMCMSLAMGQDTHPQPQLKHQQPLTWCV